MSTGRAYDDPATLLAPGISRSRRTACSVVGRAVPRASSRSRSCARRARQVVTRLGRSGREGRPSCPGSVAPRLPLGGPRLRRARGHRPAWATIRRPGRCLPAIATRSMSRRRCVRRTASGNPAAGRSPPDAALIRLWSPASAVIEPRTVPTLTFPVSQRNIACRCVRMCLCSAVCASPTRTVSTAPRYERWSVRGSCSVVNGSASGGWSSGLIGDASPRASAAPRRRFTASRPARSIRETTSASRSPPCSAPTSPTCGAYPSCHSILDELDTGC